MVNIHSSHIPWYPLTLRQHLGGRCGVWGCISQVLEEERSRNESGPTIILIYSLGANIIIHLYKVSKQIGKRFCPFWVLLAAHTFLLFFAPCATTKRLTGSLPFNKPTPKNNTTNNHNSSNN